ncbi:MAG: hypothetical protein KGY66_06140 [Candidatus Thermoplasmatota archaeon]|nr:hypothetical protein [Candidatus Thermoplasmatota archaeon]MBS3790478.1 hypothetical protein [Candidatus Thermoplasmatota archaeon]
MKDSIIEVSYALKIFPEIFKDFDELEPIDILRKLAQRFGLPIKIGEKKGKFIYKSKININDDDETPIVEDKNRRGHSFIQPKWVKMFKNRRIMICSLAFCIDLTRYKAWSHGLELNYLKEVQQALKSIKI